MASLVLFLVGSALCGTAGSLASLVFSAALQGADAQILAAQAALKRAEAEATKARAPISSARDSSAQGTPSQVVERVPVRSPGRAHRRRASRCGPASRRA